MKTADLPKDVLYIIDDIRYDWYEINAARVLKEEDISSIKVIKDKNKLSLYNALNYNGVIIIRLKGGKD